MSGITSHVLDTSRGAPASGIPITLELQTASSDPPQWQAVGQATTDDDGRVTNLATTVAAGQYRISFDVDTYFQQQDVESFYRVIRIEFNVADAAQHFHIPLLLNPFGYSTYRGS